MSDKLLYTTKELFDHYLGHRTYSIPPYQRGYKWDAGDIRRLLDDVDAFSPDDDLDLFYCLQNITLVEKGDQYNVVDGQQRLTTLIVILSYFGEHDLIKGKLHYNVRPETEAFLQEYIFKPSNLADISDWDGLLTISKDLGKDYDYQDIYYLFNAYKTAERWFDQKPGVKGVMKDKILNHIKVIVNLPKNIEEQELFENLNGKRVPLDGADLIRALIITRVAKRDVGEVDDSTKQRVLINERRVKIGMLLDRISQWWNDANRQAYFKQFTKEVKVDRGNSVLFDDTQHQINNLYKLYSLLYCDGTLSLETFECRLKEDGFLNELQLLQRTMENWYNDSTLYHLVLFASIYADIPFKEMHSQWQSRQRKSFITWLKERITQINVFDELLQPPPASTPSEGAGAAQHPKESVEPEQAEHWYDKKLVPVVTLLDIISLIDSEGHTKLPAEYFRAHKEDLEHIFPQTPIGDKIKDKAKQTTVLRQYLSIINEQLPDDEQLHVDDAEIDWDNQDWRESIKAKIEDRIKKVIPINSLGNMCLLHESVNRGYGNDFFLEKRIDIMKKSRDWFIRPHVYDAFNKKFLERQDNDIDILSMTKWDKSDIKARRKDMVDEITKFLIPQNEKA